MNQILKVELEKMNSNIKGKWTPELDEVIKKSTDAIMKRNIITMDSIAIDIMSQEEKWNNETFEKYFVFIEGIKSHIDNSILKIINLVNDAKKGHEIQVMSFFGANIKIERVSKKNGLFIFGLDESGQKFDGIFEVDMQKFVISEDFIKKVVKNVFESVINGKSLLNVNEKFLIGKNAHGKIEVFNTIEGLMALNKD